ncbi:hypothetical protein [Hymenobacter gummosus]|nr:hypothetical protein [Hymenobacter gummosus]
MSKAPKEVDFRTTGRQPSEQDFARISEWIKQNKQRGKGRPAVNQLCEK